MTKERIPGEAEPTEAQKKAGNYFKGHKYLHGMRISVENAAGTERRGKDKEGTPWVSDMNHDYGYIRGTTGKDKDHLDVFLGPEADNPSHKVYIIDQDNDEGDFDEHKVMMGFPSANEAYHAYHSNYPEGYSGFHDMTDSDLPTFKRWAFAGKGAKGKRASEMKYFNGGGVETNDFVDVPEINMGKGGSVMKIIEELMGRVKHIDDMPRHETPPLYAAEDAVDGYHQTNALSDILKSGELNNTRASNNDQGWVPPRRGGAYMWSSPDIARAQREVSREANPADTPILRLGLRPSKHKMVSDEDAGNVPWQKSFREGSFATETPISISDIEAIYTGDPKATIEAMRKVMGFAEGGSVDEKAYVGYRGRRAESNNDREGAKELPLQLARGAAAGTLGFGGDIEGLLRSLAQLVGANVDSTPALPTSDFYNDALPFAPTSSVGRAALSLGMLGGVPASGPASAGVRALRAARRFAKGGTVTGQETVGLATFGGADGTQGQGQTQSAASGAGGSAGAGSGGSSGAGGAAGVFDPRYGLTYDGSLPDLVAGAGGAPSKNLAPPYTLGGINTAMASAFDMFPSMRPMEGNFQQAPDDALRQTILSGNSGTLDRGAAAFMGKGFAPWQSSGETESGTVDASAERTRQNEIDALFQTAAGLGIDTSQYSRNVAPGGFRGERTGNDVRGLYDDLGAKTKDYYGVAGMSSGWTGSKDPRGASRTLYRNVNGTLLPVSSPQHFHAREDSGWAKNEGAETLTALSMMLPAVGGWAGLIGQAGTAAAPYINAAGSALYGGATGGSQGALGALYSQLGGLAGGAAGSAIGSGYDNVGRQIGSRIASEAYNRDRRG